MLRETVEVQDMGPLNEKNLEVEEGDWRSLGNSSAVSHAEWYHESGPSLESMY